MRFYPRNAQARADALAGPGHIGNRSQPSLAENMDRLNRYKPALNANTVLAAYGGSV